MSFFRTSLIFVIASLVVSHEVCSADLEFPLMMHPQFFEDEIVGEEAAWNDINESLQPLIAAKDVNGLYSFLTQGSFDFGMPNVPIISGNLHNGTTVDLHLKLIFRQLQAIAASDHNMLDSIYRAAIRGFDFDILLVAVASTTVEATPSIDLNNEDFILALGTLLESGNPQLELEARTFQKKVIVPGQGNELASLREFALDFMESRWGGDPRDSSQFSGREKARATLKEIKEEYVPPFIDTLRGVIADRSYLRQVLQVNTKKSKVDATVRLVKSLLTGEPFVMGTDYPDYGSVNAMAMMLLGDGFYEVSSKAQRAQSKRGEYELLTVDELRRFLGFVGTADPSEFSLPPQEPILEYRQIQWIDKLIALTDWPEADNTSQDEMNKLDFELSELGNPYLELMILSRLAKRQGSSGILWRVLFFTRLEEVALAYPKDALQFFRMFMVAKYPPALAHLARDFVHEFKTQIDGLENIRPEHRRSNALSEARLPSEARQLILIDSLFWSDREIQERLREGQHFDLPALATDFGTGLLDLHQFVKTMRSIVEKGELVEKPLPNIILKRSWDWMINPRPQEAQDFDRSVANILNQISPAEFLLICREAELPERDNLYHLFSHLILKDPAERGEYTNDVLREAIHIEPIRKELGETYFEGLNALVRGCRKKP